MEQFELDLKPVSYITTDAIGEPGNRVFYLQGAQGERVVTLLVEKVQIQTLALGVEEFLVEISKRFPEMEAASVEYNEKDMRITPPVDPLFRIADLGLAYDTEEDLVILLARSVVPEDTDPAEASTVRFWCTRSQIRCMCHWGLVISGRGRPTCPQCGEPMDPQGHFCPKKNGHKH